MASILHSDFYEDNIVPKLDKKLKEMEATIKNRLASIDAAIRKTGGGAVTSKNIKDQRNYASEIARVKTELARYREILKQATALEKKYARTIAQGTDANIKRAAAIKKQQLINKQAVQSELQMQGVLNKREGVLKKLTKAVTAYVGAWLGMQTVVNILRNFFTTAVKLDSIRLSLETIIESSQQLVLAETFLLDISRRYGAEIVSLTENYVRFIAALKASSLSLYEANRAFEGIVKTSAVLGLSAKRTELALLALEQIASKGTVSMEELRRQLGDQIPGALQIAAKAMDTTVSSLFDMIRANELLSEDFIPAFTKELETAFSLDNIDRVKTMRAATNRLKTEWQSFVKEFGNTELIGGIIDFYAKGIRRFTNYLKTPDALRLEATFNKAKETVDNLVSSLEDATDTRRQEVFNRAIESTERELTRLVDKYGDLDLEGNLVGGTVQNITKYLGYSRDEYIKARDEIAFYTNQLELLRTALKNLNEDQQEQLGIIGALKEALNKYNEELDKARSLSEILRISDDIEKTEIKLKSIVNLLKNLREEVGEEEDLDIPDFAQGILNAIDAQADAQDKYNEQTDELVRQTEQALLEQADAQKRYNALIAELRADFNLDEQESYNYRLALLDRLREADKVSEKEYLNAKLSLWYDYNKELIEEINNIYQQIGDAFLFFNDANITEVEQSIDASNERLSQLEKEINEQTRLKEQGYRNDYDLLVSEKEREMKLRNEKFEELKKLRKREAAIELAQQTGSLITASAKIFEGTAKDPVTLAIAIGAIASMVAAFAGFKAKIKSIESEEPKYAEGGRVDARKGGKLRGKRHIHGGIKLEAEDQEFIVKARSARKADKLLNKINDGEIDDRLFSLWELNRPNMRFLGGHDQLNISELTSRLDTLNGSVNTQTDVLKSSYTGIELSDGRILLFNKNSKEFITPNKK
jgi:tape measure domain-containing protein